MNIISDAVETAGSDIQILAIPDVHIQNSDFKNVLSNEESLIKCTLFPQL